MKVIQGKGVPLGRLASFAAKESLKGEDISIINCNEVIITGSYKSTKENFDVKRSRVGSGQKGPKHHSTTEKMVKRAIRGMLPNVREGRGKVALKRIKCYSKVPKELEKEKAIEIPTSKKIKYSLIKEFAK